MSPNDQFLRRTKEVTPNEKYTNEGKYDGQSTPNCNKFKPPHQG